MRLVPSLRLIFFASAWARVCVCRVCHTWPISHISSVLQFFLGFSFERNNNIMKRHKSFSIYRNQRLKSRSECDCDHLNANACSLPAFLFQHWSLTCALCTHTTPSHWQYPIIGLQSADTQYNNGQNDCLYSYSVLANYNASSAYIFCI